MNDVPGLPVKGYKPTQSPEAIAAVDRLKELEERVLREIDEIQRYGMTNHGFVDESWLLRGRQEAQTGFMMMARAIFQPGRVKLPGDA